MLNLSHPKSGRCLLKHFVQPGLWEAEKPISFPQWSESVVPPLIQDIGGTMKELHVGNSHFL